MKTRILSLALCITSLVVLLSSTWSVAEETSAPDDFIVSETIDAFPKSIGLSENASAHGQNQTRLVVTDTGIYVTCPFGYFTDSEGDGAYAGLWRIGPDQEPELLWQDTIRCIQAGTSTNAFADNDGNIWTVSQWDAGSGAIELRAWEWNVKENRMIPYAIQGYTARGNRFGKPMAVYDKTLNRIYTLTMGGDAGTSHIVWFIYDLNTRSWEKTAHYYKQSGGRTDYHFMYADGNGGFFAIDENCFSSDSAPTDIEGMSLGDAVRNLRRLKVGIYYVWQTSHMIYVPNADENLGYNIELLPGKYDIMNGMVPNNWNAKNELYLDESTRYLYSITTLEEGDGIAEVRNILCIYDMNQKNEDIQKDGPYKKLVEKELNFMYGYGSFYSKKICRDTLGNLYIVAMAEARYGDVEIWKMSDPLCSDIKLLAVEGLRGYASRDISYQVYGMISANNRSNSPESDKAHIIAWADQAGGWFYFSVDFAKLRARTNG